MTGDDGLSTFGDSQFRRVKAFTLLVVILLLALLLSQMFKETNTVVDVYIGIVIAAIGVLAVGVFRAFRIGIVVDDERVVARTTYSTRSWTWDQIRKAGTIEQTPRGVPVIGIPGIKASPMAESHNVIPVIRTTSGRVVPLRGLKVRVRETTRTNWAGTTWVDDAIDEINERAARRRAAGGAGGLTPS